MINKLTVIILLVLAGTHFAAAETPDNKISASTQFTHTQEILNRADESRDADKYIDAIKLYREALNSYVALSKDYPGWQSGITQFRIAYCNNQLESLLQRVDGKELKELTASLKTNAPASSTSDLPTAPPSTNRPAYPSTRVDTELVRLKAKSLLEKGDPATAKAMLVNALQQEPDNMKLRLLMGITHCRAREFDNAVYLMESLVQDDKLDPVAHVVLGTAYLGLGKVNDAKKQMYEALAINPRLGDAHYNLCQVLLAETPADTNAARKHYEAALQLGSKPDPNLSAIFKIPAEQGKK